MAVSFIEIKNENFALIPEAEYQETLARAAGVTLPKLPEADENGNRPALEAVRVVIARGLISDRISRGWFQQDLAERAEVPLNTIQALERAEVKPTRSVMEKIDDSFEFLPDR